MNKPILGFEHVYQDNGGKKTLLLLHGTGGDENDLIPLGTRLDSSANILSPRGKILEDGQLRFFKRLSPGIFDRQDLKLRSQELSEFLVECSKIYNFPLDSVTAVGYSNGANIALHLLASNFGVLNKAILLRPMATALPDELADLSGVRLLVLSGLADPMISLDDAQSLVKILQAQNSDVEFHALPAGHGLTAEDVRYAQEWLNKLFMV